MLRLLTVACDATTCMGRQTYEFDDIADIIIYRIMTNHAIIPLTYPLYKQCDPRWGNDTIV